MQERKDEIRSLHDKNAYCALVDRVSRLIDRIEAEGAYLSSAQIGEELKQALCAAEECAIEDGTVV